MGMRRLRRGRRAMVVAAAVGCLPVAAPAADLASLHAKLMQGSALMQAGRMEEAVQVNGEALALAEARGDRSLALQTLLVRLAMLTALGRLPDAEAAARQARALADAEGQPPPPVSTHIDLSTGLLYSVWGRPAQAAPFVHRALAGVDAVDPSGGLRQAGLGALAQVEADRGHYAEAAQLTEQAIALGVRGLPPGPANLVDRQVDALMRLAVLRTKRDDAAGARDAWAQALLQQQRATGPDSGAAAQVALARIHHGLGQDAEARAAWARARAAALADREAPAQGPGTPTDFMAHLQRAGARISAWQAMARLARDLGRPDDAEQAFRQAMALSERLEGPANMTLLATQVELADMLRMRGDGAAAEAVYATTITALEQAPGGSAVSLAQALDGLARVRWAQGRRDAVEPLLHRAIDLHAQHIASDHPQLAPALDLLAELQTATDRPAEAQATLARAAAIRALPR